MTLESIRALVFAILEPRFRLAGVAAPESINYTFDMFASGVLDSLGFVELMVALEGRLGVTIDFAEMPTGEISNFARFCAFVHGKAVPVHHGGGAA